jgi:HlyD family secretion protein
MKPAMKTRPCWQKIGLLLGSLLLILATVRWWTTAGSQAPDAGGFQLAVVTRDTLTDSVSCTGTLKAVGTVEVGTQVSGTIERVLVDYNHRVRKGQVLAELDTALFQASVDKSHAELRRAEALLAQARAEFQRHQPLLAEGHLSTQEFLGYETALATAQADLQSSRAALKQAETNLRYAQIRSPIDGTVIERQIEAGQTVAASFSTPTLFLIAEDLARMEIQTDVDESDIGLIRLGQDVIFTVQAYPDRKFNGTVSQVRLNPTETSNVVTYTVIVEAPNSDNLLLPGMTATADFIVSRTENVLLVPNAALQFVPDGAEPGAEPALTLLRRGQAPRRVAVKTGHSDGSRTVILDGSVAAGDRVVIGRRTGTAGGKNRNGSNLFSKLMPRPPRRGPGPGPGNP